MEYIIPNFGQYGYVEPKSTINWKIFVWLLIFAAVFSGVVYFFTKKEKDEKDKPIETKDNSNPYQLQSA